MIEDIKYLDKNTCLDMNNFNFMIGFNTGEKDDILTAMNEKEQVELYKRMRKEFLGTSLDRGVRETWFAEFTPSYCTNCDNCGEKFFLLERNGDIYSCVRGQKNPNYFYGNIYEDSVKEIMNNAKRKIFENHNRVGFNEECARCKYLYLCKTGCPYVKNNYNINKSYTCKLQHEIYKDNEDIYKKDEYNEESVYVYLNKMHPKLALNYYPEKNTSSNSNMPTLKQIIQEDEKLKNIYSDDIFILKVDDIEYKLESQILKNVREIIYLTDESKVKLYIKEGVLEDCLYPANNSLYMMLLSGDTVKYGDEGRIKQEHVMTHQIYTNTIKREKSDKNGYYVVDITKIISLYKYDISEENPNNLFLLHQNLEIIIILNKRIMHIITYKQ